MLDDAAFIAQDHLTFVTKALLSDRINSANDFFALPSAFTWSTDLRVSRSPSQLLDALRHVRDKHHEQRTQRVERRLEHASVLAPKLILRTHTSRWWGQTDLPGEKYSTVSLLVQNEDTWKVLVSQFCDKMPARASGSTNADTHPTDDHAANILQNRLDQFGDCVVNRDAEQFLDIIDNTLVVQRDGCCQVLDTVEKKLARFRDVARFLDRLDVRQITRVVKNVHRLTDDIIVGTTHSYMVIHDKFLQPAYPSSVVMRRVDDRWRLLSVLNSIEVASEAQFAPR